MNLLHCFQNNSTTLLNFIVHVLCKNGEESNGKQEAACPLPDPSTITPAAAASFLDLDKELHLLKKELGTLGRKVGAA